MLFLDSAFPSKDRKDKAVPMVVLALVLFKCLRTLSLYMATDLFWDKGLQVAPLLFWLLVISAATTAAFYKPLSRPLLQIHVCLRLIVVADNFLVDIRLWLWCLVVPSRALLVVDFEVFRAIPVCRS